MVPPPANAGESKSTDGEVANALVCKISIRGFDSRSVLQVSKKKASLPWLALLFSLFFFIFLAFDESLPTNPASKASFRA